MMSNSVVSAVVKGRQYDVQCCCFRPAPRGGPGAGQPASGHWDGPAGNGTEAEQSLFPRLHGRQHPLLPGFLPGRGGGHGAYQG